MQILQFVMFKYGGGGMWTLSFTTTLQNTAIWDWFGEFKIQNKMNSTWCAVTCSTTLTKKG
jgi:hypothetical protein